MRREGIISGVSISHRNASIDQLGQVPFESQQSAVSTLLDAGASEAYVLHTCNRVEAYVVADSVSEGHDILDTLTEALEDDICENLSHEESLRHLLRVAAGLESLVLGEDQILGQVRDAYEDARRVGGIGPVLEDGITKAIHVGERARTETAINEGVVSLASAAVRLAEEKHGLVDGTAIVIGTGEMGTLAAKRLASEVETLLLANRTRKRATELANSIEPVQAEIETLTIEEVEPRLGQADVVISATASEDTILGVESFETVGDTFVVDITRPRDIPADVSGFSHVTVYDLDNLESVTEKTRKMRKEAAEAVDDIVDEEFERLLVQYKRNRADQVISAMYESAERVKTTELEETLSKLELDEESEAVVEAMADAIVSQLLAAPTNSLRDAAEADDWSTIHTALQLFNPRFGPNTDDVSPEFLTKMRSEEMPDVDSEAHVSSDVSPGTEESSD